MAGPSLDNAVSTIFGSGNSHAVTAPTGIAVGDIIIATGHSLSGGQTSAPSGAGFTTYNSNGSFYAFYKIATASDVGATTYTFTQGISGAAAYTMALVKRVDPEISHIMGSGTVAGPFDGSSVQPSGATSTSITVPVMTASRAQYGGDTELFLCFYVANTAAAAITVPGGQSSTAEAHSNGLSVILGYESISVPGSLTTRVATCGASASNMGFGFLIPPKHQATTSSVSFPGDVLNIGGWWSGAPTLKPLTAGVADPGRNLPYWETDIFGRGAASASVTQYGLATIGQPLLVVDVSGSLSGTITAGGVPVSGVRVNVHWRPSWDVIWTGYTDASGNWSTPARFRVGDSRYVVTVEAPSTGTVYDSLVADKPLPLA